VNECLDQCVEWGGTEQAGTCEGGQVCCDGATPPTNPLAELIPSAKDVGLLLAERFSRQTLAYSSVANLPGDGYKTACEWYGALGVANLTDSQELLASLVTKFDPLKGDFISAMTGGEAHVDRYIYGMVPLEIYLQTGDDSYLPLGIQTADKQQTTNQTRDAIDDMFMMTGLQLEAYRATQNDAYLTFMSDIMVDYLGAQQDNGLFFHNVTEAPVHWCRGNGWFAAGMAEMMRDLPPSSSNYPTIEAGYKKMMDGLVPLQGPNGLWYQVLNLPNDSSNWEETSGSAMFTYAMIAGVRRGILDATTYVPVIEAAWAGLQTKISAQGDVSGICVGTWYKSTPQEYMALTKLTGDGHGQAPVLWAAAELLR
jgi:unsaturated rhamnogalacturonyl hydrolase